MTLRYRLHTANGSTPILEMPQADFWEAHTALLEAMGVKDLGPVVDEAHAERIAAIAAKRYRDSVALRAGSGINSGKTSRRVKRV